MKLLAIDTSTDKASLALSVNGEIKTKEQLSQKKHASWILEALALLLAEAELSLKTLDGLVFGRGPGSFTGLRIACSIAKGLAFANDLPLYPVSCLKAIAWPLLSQEPLKDSGILAMMDARMNQVYWACYHPSLAEEEFVSYAKDIQLPPFSLYVTGFGYQEYQEQLSVDIQSKIKAYQPSYPKAEIMIQLVLAGGLNSVYPAEAAPQYLRNQVVHGGNKIE